MIIQTKIVPENSLLLLMDKHNGDIPESMDGDLIVAKPTCIAIGTLSEADGETSVTMSDERLEITGVSEFRKVFNGVVATPRKQLDLCTILLKPILTLTVQNIQSNLEIWANDEIEPNKLYILVS